MNFLSSIKKVHFVGIGGIGMSALVKYMHHHNISVTGSDRSESSITTDLQEHYDIDVHIGARPENVTSEHDMIIYSPAVPTDDSERQEGRNFSIPEFSFPVVGPKDLPLVDPERFVESPFFQDRKKLLLYILPSYPSPWAVFASIPIPSSSGFWPWQQLLAPFQDARFFSPKTLNNCPGT